MDLLTVALMLLAGLSHASWHSLVKGSDDQLTVLAGMGLVSFAAALPILPLFPLARLDVWLVILASVTLHAGYKVFLCSAYGRSDFGRAFPLVRGLVPLFAACIALVTLGQIPTGYQWLGIVLISSGLVVIAAEQLVGGSWALFGATSAAAAAVASYSVLDAYGTRLTDNWLAFTAWLIVLDNAFFLAISWMLRRSLFWSRMRIFRWRVLATGVLGLLSFGVFLWALSRQPVGVVGALRETSVLFAVIIGVIIHRESFSPRRIVATALMMGGIIIVAR